MTKKDWVMSAVILMLVATLVVSLSRCSSYKNEVDIADHNLKVMQDSLRTLTLKNGDQVATIGSYIIEKQQLEDYLNISKQEIRELERKLGNLAYLSNIEGEMRYDTITVTDTIQVIGDSTLIDIHYMDKWLILNGLTVVVGSTATTTFDNIVVPCPLRVGLTDDYRIWVETKNPYMTVTTIEGAFVNGSNLVQKKKHWNVGIQAGIGGQYGIVHKQFDVGPYIGVGISYGFNF